MAQFEIKDGVAIIPDGTTEIGKYAFDFCESLTSVTIPDGVTSIRYAAFKDCSSLTSVTIPDSVTMIEHYAFIYGCTSLENIVVADGNPVYDSREGCNAIIETATNTLIKGCNTTVIPESVTEIYDGAFRDCILLESIAIPESVTEIGESVFRGCISLESVTIPEGVKKLMSMHSMVAPRLKVSQFPSW